MFVSYKYQIFEEMKEEFKDRLGQFPENNWKQMEFVVDGFDEDHETGSYLFDILLPYGELKDVKLMYVPQPKREGDDRDDPQPLPQDEDPSRVTIT